MNDFLQSVVSLITSDEAPSFNSVLAVILLYLLALWLVFCFWVFVDAKKRYGKWWLALIISVCVFILNFPCLILYLIVRPEDEYGETSSYHGAQSSGGLEIPVARFVDDKGEVKFSLNISMNPNLSSDADISVEVGWDADRKDLSVQEISKAAHQTPVQQPADYSMKKGFFGSSKLSGFREKARNRIAKLRKQKAEVVEIKEDVDSDKGGKRKKNKFVEQ